MPSAASRSKAAPRARSWPYALLALAAGAVVFLWALATDRLLLYGDATAHLAIARRMVDSATPGLSQWGTVWLPLPHLLMAPLVWAMPLWRSGVAGSVPALAALALGTWFVHRIALRHWGRGAAAWAAVFYGLNPSLLYLSAVPMTESVYLAAFLGLVDAVDRGAAGQAGLWALAATMCRYDGWFVLPFAALALWLPGRDWRKAWRFCWIAGLGPLFWFAYNLFYLSDPLAFARGPYSARQIYLNALRHGAQRYPGDHAFWTAALYYAKDVVLTCGEPLLVVAALGVWLAARRRAGGAAWLLALPLPFYLWAMWAGNVPIFVPEYWPHGWYNVRYGVQLLPLAAVFSGAAAAIVVRAARRVTVVRLAPGVALGLAAVVGWSTLALARAPGGAIAYAEAVHNAPDRRAMERDIARALAPRAPGERVLMYYGTYPGALADDRIPVREVIQESNFRLWQAALAAPAARVDWVVLEAGGPVASGVNRAELAQSFHRVASLDEPQQPHVEVYRRNGI